MADEHGGDAADEHGGDAADEHGGDAADEHRDELPADLDAAGYVGPYAFPNVNRRRVPGTIYLVIALACVLEWVTHAGSSHVLDSPPSVSTMAMCDIPVAGPAPCQCFSPGANQTQSPG